MAFVAHDYEPIVAETPIPKPIQYYPYFHNQYLAVAASLNGGNVLATFVKMLQQWTMELGFSVPQCKYINPLFKCESHMSDDLKTY